MALRLIVPDPVVGRWQNSERDETTRHGTSGGQSYDDHCDERVDQEGVMADPS